ncbi:hypothetical protein L1987_07174 [Smallanthus sonchifolius]|uniref:Uncharacterized protein n=1 Tax=Smallanthus sonchifolius TaxID=185202 RepID=A0ACB9K003_9ASTR|nr:hypothetical protein L1987_07174 [Smallanthus sonchifolius]
MSHVERFQHLKIQLEAIKWATNNFSVDNCIGKGGFGNVYKGELVHSTGTIGYIDPVYQLTGLLTKESDIYSFGVVLFEVLCGRLCFGNENLRPLVGLVLEYYEENKISELVFSNIKDETNISSLTLFVEIAYKCLRRESEERPLATQIVSTLERALDIQEKADAKAGGILIVKVLGKNLIGCSNPYLVLYIKDRDPLQNIKTTAKYNEASVEWNEEFSLYVKDLDAQNLYILVNSMVSVNDHRRLGLGIMNLKNLTPRIPLICDLNVNGRHGDYIAELKVELFYKPTNIEDVISLVPKAPIGTPKDGGLLIIIIHNAFLYNEIDQARSSVSLLFGSELRKTQSMMNTNRPMWLREFTFMLEQPPTDENLHFEVINHYSGKEKGSMGFIDISLVDVVNKKWTNEFYKLEGDYILDHPYKSNYLRVELQWRTYE